VFQHKFHKYTIKNENTSHHLGVTDVVLGIVGFRFLEISEFLKPARRFNVQKRSAMYLPI
jgi:hypothetical protein